MVRRRIFLATIIANALAANCPALTPAGRFLASSGEVVRAKWEYVWTPRSEMGQLASSALREGMSRDEARALLGVHPFDVGESFGSGMWLEQTVQCRKFKSIHMHLRYEDDAAGVSRLKRWEVQPDSGWRFGPIF